MQHPQQVDLARLFDSYNVDYTTTDRGWLQLTCPFCHDTAQHLGWSGKVFSCYHCGRLDRTDTLAAVLGLSPAQVAHTLRNLRGSTSAPLPRFDDAQRKPARSAPVILPYGAKPLNARHQHYLRQRGFDPAALARDWGLLGTWALGPCPYRIIIPVVQGGRLACWQARDITDKSEKKYLSCPDAEATTPVKSCLYGLDQAVGGHAGRSVVVVEGPTKVWRLGVGAVATFGAMVTDEQVRLLRVFGHVYILLDEDEAGQAGAAALAARVAVLGHPVEVITTGHKDVGDLTPAEAAALMQELLQK